jgi:hypothetical protein
MADLANPKWIYAKGVLFLLAGAAASALVIIECPTVKTALLLAIAVWCFARFYYFAFYVIEHYVDPGFHFSGLWSFARYLWSKRVPPGNPTRSGHEAPSRDNAAPGGAAES